MEQKQHSGQTPAPPARPVPAPRRRRILNLRLLVETLIVAAVIAPIAYAWYSWQVKRSAEAMLERAKNLATEKDDAAAAQYYFQYLKLKPGDADVQVMLAESYDRAAKDMLSKQRAVEYYYEALGVAPADKQAELHRRLAELLIELRRFVPAEEEADELLKTNPKDPHVSRIAALALYGQSQTGGLARGRSLTLVGEAFERALRLNSGDVEVASVLAGIYRERPQLLSEQQQALSEAERQRLADAVMDAALAADPKNPKARLAHYRYRSRYRLSNPQEDLAAALKDSPNDAEVALQAAYAAQRDADVTRRAGAAAEKVQASVEQACKHYRRAIDISPSDEAAYVGLGELYATQGKFKDALATWRLGLEKGKKDSIELNARLAELLIAQGQTDEADTTIRGLEQTAARLGPRLPPAAKLAIGRLNDYLRAQWLVAKKKYLEAIPLLRRVAVGQQGGAAEIARSLKAWQSLAVAYAAGGQWDQAAAAYEQAAALAPKVGWLRAMAADAWGMAGRADAAEASYEQALTLGAPPDTWLALAGVRLQRQLRVSKTARDWAPFNKALAEAKKAQEKTPFAEPWRLALMEVEYLVARGEEKGEAAKAIDDVVQRCHAVAHDYPNDPKLLLALAAVYQRLDKPAEADQVVTQLEQINGQAGNACLLRARLAAGRKQYGEARKVLTQGLETLPQAVHPLLRRELAQVALREGHADQAAEQLLKLHEKEPGNREWVLRLAELAFESGKLANVEQRERELRDLEGPDGLFWRYYQARRLLAEAAGPNDPKLAEAAKLQAFIRNQRPAWPKTYLLQGLLAEAGGKYEQATEAYQEAVRLGEQLPLAYQRLISLLLQAGRADEADHYLLLMQDQIAPADSLTSLEMVVAARRGQIDRALDAARRGVRQRPNDPLAHLWLGQMLLAADKAGEAETMLKKAVTLAPDDARTLGGLFDFYIRTRQSGPARETLQAVAKNEKLGRAPRALFLAQGYEVLGDSDKAEANCREAARLEPDDATASLRLAGFLARCGADAQRQEAERLLRDVLKRQPDSAPARRMLAGLLVEHGGQEQWQEAQRLMEGLGKDTAMAGLNRRAQAMLLSRRGGRQNLEKAQQILEELTLDAKKAAPADRVWLAQLYEIDGKPDLAGQQYLKLVGVEKPSPAHLAAYIELLLRHERLNEAEPWLKKLEGLSPDDLGAAALRARWLRGKGHPDKIEPLVEPLAEKLLKKATQGKRQEAALAFAVGSLYSAVDQYPAAERWYRRLLALEPERFQPLAIVLAQQGQMGQAIELCRKAAQSDPSVRPALTVAMALLAGKPSAEDFQLAEPILTKAVAGHKDDLDLLNALASVRVIQQRLDEAVSMFRQIVAVKPGHVSALNNLATLLAEQPDHRGEALECVDRAIGIVGPQPGLLDTKGMILVFQNKPDEAVPLLEEAAATPQSDPRYHFHLAVACDRAGEPAKARAALGTARKGNLTGCVLTPSDRQMLEELEKKYGKSPLPPGES
jgi:cellulose synthase operon protein C